MHNIRLFCGTQCSAASSWRQARTKIFRTTDEADTEVSRLRSNRHINCFQCERATLWIICHKRFHYSLSFALLCRCSQGENSVALINVAINVVYEYFSFVIYFSNIFFSKCFSNFFSKFVFWGLYSRCSPVYRAKRILCICVMKNMIYRPI